MIDMGKFTKLNANSLIQLSYKSLFGDTKEIVISHIGESYMLTITKQKNFLRKVKHHLVRTSPSADNSEVMAKG